MPSIGDTKTIFGRTYVYSNPNQAIGPGTWLLSDGEGSLSGNQQTEHVVYGQAIVDDNSIPIKRGMLVVINDDKKATAAVGSSIETATVVGVAIDPANNGQAVQFTQNTAFEFFNATSITDEAESALDVGKPYYLSTQNPGKWTKNPDRSVPGNIILQCGTAMSDYYMAIDIQPVERYTEESVLRETADNALSARISVLEEDTTTATALSQESDARVTADQQHSTRLDALEAADVVITGDLDAALIEAKAYTDQRMAGIPAIDYSIDYGEYA